MSRRRFRSLMPLVVLPVLIGQAATATEKPAGLCLEGVNISGGEYGGREGRHGRDYIVADSAVMAPFADAGMTVVRLPFRWERLQPVLSGPLSRAELQRIDDAVATATGLGLAVILDPHNFGRYDEGRIGIEVADADFADLWRRLAAAFANRPGVSFGLMNEPHGIPAPVWLASANAAIAAIRSAGANNLVLVPGTRWTGAVTWFDTGDGGSNADVMGGVVDPADHFAYELHQYLDSDYSGTHRSCEKAGIAREGLAAVAGWLKARGRRGFLGEIGVSDDPACLAGLADIVASLRADPAAWLGYAYWAGGAWWPKDEPLNVNPVDGRQKPQMQVLARALAEAPAGKAAACAPQ